MNRKKRTPQNAGRLTPVSEVSTLAWQLDKELHRAMIGTAEDRDTLISTSGLPLTHLKPLIDTFTYRSEVREQAIRKMRNVFHEQEAPSAGTARPGRLAMQLAQALTPYLTGTVSDRTRLSTSCHLVLCHLYIKLSTLLIADRDDREEHVWLDTQVTPVIIKAFVSPMNEVLGKEQRPH